MENLLNALEEWAKISPEAIPPEIRAQIPSLQLSSAGSQSSPTSTTPVSDGDSVSSSSFSDSEAHLHLNQLMNMALVNLKVRTKFNNIYHHTSAL